MDKVRLLVASAIWLMFTGYAFADCTATGVCSKTYKVGTVVTLTATPDAGSYFSHWEGDFCNGSKEPICTFKVPDVKEIKISAVFNKLPKKPTWRKADI